MEEERRRRDEQGRARLADGTLYSTPAPAAKAQAAPSAPATIGVRGLAAEDSVTNVQHAGVDEGGIVKVHGDHLVVLRRGRLFTVNIRDQQLKPVAAADAFGNGID